LRHDGVPNERSGRSLARTIIDSVGVELELETEDFFRGLDLADAAIERFRNESRAPVRLALEADLSGVETAAQQARELLSGASRGQRLALTVDVGDIDEAQQRTAALTQTIETLAAGKGDLAGFFTGLAEGAREAFAEFQQGADAVAPAVAEASDAQRELAARTLEAAEAFRAAGVAEATLNATLERSGLLSVQAAQALQAAAVAARQAAEGLGPLAQGASALGLLGTQADAAEKSLAKLPARAAAIDAVAAAMARGSRGSLDFQVGLRRLEQQQEAARQRAELLATANQRLVAGMSAAGREAFAASAGTRAWELGLANLRARQGALDTSFAISGKGAEKLRAGFQALALQATGTSPAIANLVNGLLLLGPGSTAVLGVAAAAAVIGVAYNALTKNAREAKEEAEKLTEELIRQGNIRVDPAFEARESLKKLDTQADRTRAELARLEEQQQRLVQIQSPSTPLGGEEALFESATFADASARIAQLQADLERLAKAQKEARNEIAEAIQASSFGDIRDLSIQIATFGQGEIAARKLAVAMDGSLEPGVRKVTLALLDQLDALQKNAKAQEELQRLANQMFLDRQAIFAGAGDLGERVVILKPRLDSSELESALDRVAAEAADALGEPIDGGLNDELTEAEANARALASLLREIGLRLKDIGNANVSGSTDDLAAAIVDVTRGLDRMVGAASNIGLISDEAARALNSVLDLGDALANVAASASAGNILGLVGAGVNLIGGLFGGGPSESDRIREENSRAIERLTATIEQRGIGDLGRARDLVGSDEFQQLAQLFRISQHTGLDLDDGFQQALDAAGLSLRELQVIAEQVAPGLELFDSKGRLVAGALDDLAKAIDAVVESETGVPTAFDAVLKLLDFESRAKGEEQTPLDAFERAIEALGLVDTNLDDRFKGADTEEEFREVLLGIIEDLQKGALSPAERGSLTPEDIDRILELGIDALEGFTDSVDKAKNSLLEMSNVPLGFRQAHHAFEAQTPASSVIVSGGGSDRVTIPPARVRGGDGASLPTDVRAVAEAIARQRPTVVFEKGSIEISGANKSARELFTELQDEAERVSMAGGVTFLQRFGG
jgi:hypothetical protein